mmetsp:Transcript_30137/g.71702  ORF Transcript_30137/g.71702 Transcript_30137/m.71702 type:complete len:241 (+) Transcript_30137:959-1681(+)
MAQVPQRLVQQPAGDLGQLARDPAATSRTPSCAVSVRSRRLHQGRRGVPHRWHIWPPHSAWPADRGDLVCSAPGLGAGDGTGLRQERPTIHARAESVVCHPRGMAGGAMGPERVQRRPDAPGAAHGPAAVRRCPEQGYGAVQRRRRQAARPQPAGGEALPARTLHVRGHRRQQHDREEVRQEEGHYSGRHILQRSIGARAGRHGGLGSEKTLSGERQSSLQRHVQGCLKPRCARGDHRLR